MNKKTLSQNWLNDQLSLEAMVLAGEVMRDDVVLEIGPGPGALTEHLVKAAKNVVAIEFDRTLAENLHRVVEANNLEVHHADILSFDTSVMPKHYKVVANIPYHITAKIVQHFIQSENKPAVMAMLVQKEVAERIAAGPGAMSILAISVQMLAEVQKKETVKAELFTPPPKVDSQILQLRLRDKPLFEVEEQLFYKLVKAGFGERRKKLVNSLAGGLHLEKSYVLELLNAASVDESARAQDLSLDMWYTLYTKYAKSDK